MAAPYAPIPAGVIAEMNNEGLANGVWNSIINHYFDQTNYIVAPEYRLDNNTRPDLLVFRPNLEKRFVYEGKKTGQGLASWDDLTFQALGYLQQINKVGPAKVALITRGTDCRFIKL